MNEHFDKIKGPHQGQPLLLAGEPLKSARAAMIMVHGRGATAEDILMLSDDLKQPGFAYLAPQAAGNTWYPYSFLAPIESNEPWLSSALAVIASLLEQLTQAGISTERTMLLGFSQGACLTLEFAARSAPIRPANAGAINRAPTAGRKENARRYGGVAGLSGGLIGPDDTPRNYPGSLAGTPFFLGCSDIDPHIPKARVQESSEVLRQLGGIVTMRLYPGMGHTVNRDELRFVQAMMSELLA